MEDVLGDCGLTDSEEFALQLRAHGFNTLASMLTQRGGRLPPWRLFNARTGFMKSESTFKKLRLALQFALALVVAVRCVPLAS